jgi:predicted ester cyclase
MPIFLACCSRGAWFRPQAKRNRSMHYIQERKTFMSTEENKALIRRGFEEGINQRNYDIFDETIASNYVNHSMPAPAPGPEGFKQVINMFIAGFPDLQVELEDVLAEGDKVSTRGVMHGTHTGLFNGIAPTGKTIAITYIDSWRIEGGKAVENWVQLDMMGMMQQLGVIPTPGQAPG